MNWKDQSSLTIPPHLLLAGSPQLQSLVLAGNQLGSCDLCQLAALPRLRSLDLSHNNLFEVSPTLLLSSPLLQTLNLSDNSISSLTGKSSDINNSSLVLGIRTH